MQIGFPIRIDHRGRTAETTHGQHVREMIEQLLFTSPGERVNQPEFGCGLMKMVFGPNSDELASATQFLIQGSIQQWLGHLVQVQEVEVRSEEEKLLVTIKYTLIKTQQQQMDSFEFSP